LSIGLDRIVNPPAVHWGVRGHKMNVLHSPAPKQLNFNTLENECPNSTIWKEIGDREDDDRTVMASFKLVAAQARVPHWTQLPVQGASAFSAVSAGP